MSIIVEWKRTKELEKKIQAKLSQVEANVEQALATAATKVMRAANDNAPEGVTGNLARDIKIRPNGKFKYEIYNDAKYAAVIEFGRRPKSGFPNWHDPMFQKWVEKKLGDRKLSFVVARAIYEHGTKPHPFMRKALLDNKSWIESTVKRAITSALR
jgi:HK97 gp10 family phage protein